MRFNMIAACLSLVGTLLVAGSGAANAMANSSDGLNRHVVLHNTTDTSVHYLYITNAGYSKWGYDRLGSSETIVSDEKMQFNIDDGSGYCRFDIKAVFRNGEVRTGYGLNVCAGEHIDITASGVVTAY